jgi:hypothetical protein
VLPLVEAEKQKTLKTLKKRLKKADEKSFLSDDDSDESSSSSECTGKLSTKSKTASDLPRRTSPRIMAQAPKPNAPNH